MSPSWKVVKISPLVSWKEYCSMQDHHTMQQIAQFFLYKGKVQEPAIKCTGHPQSCFHAAGSDLAANNDL